MLTIGILREVFFDEKRVAATPATVAKIIKMGHAVLIEKNAGVGSYLPDQEFIASGATVCDTAEKLLNTVDILLKIHPPTGAEIDHLKNAATVISPLFPARNPELILKLNAKYIRAFALELIPRIARAQSMDILSSMSSVAGYKSILLAANFSNKLFPMMTTAAGTLFPAKVMVIGAGVAGLQAIATARRLGAVVTAFDTRPVANEQVKSLGAHFILLETHGSPSEDAGGYAKEQTEAFYRQEQNIITEHLKDTDVIVTTALIPGKKAPLLITENMVKQMKPGSVIIDLAIEQGGNCALTEPGQIVVKENVTLVGLLNLPSLLPTHASQLYANNVFSFLNYLLSYAREDLEDDIIKNCLVTLQGETVHPTFQKKDLHYAH